MDAIKLEDANTVHILVPYDLGRTHYLLEEDREKWRSIFPKASVSGPGWHSEKLPQFEAAFDWEALYVPGDDAALNSILDPLKVSSGSAELIFFLLGVG